jgi:hypothetical protein
VFWGLDDGNVVGARRFCAHASAVLIIHVACATLLAKAQRKEGSFGTLRLSPIAKKLEQLAAATNGAEGVSVDDEQGGVGRSHAAAARADLLGK